MAAKKPAPFRAPIHVPETDANGAPLGPLRVARWHLQYAARELGTAYEEASSRVGWRKAAPLMKARDVVRALYADLADWPAPATLDLGAMLRAVPEVDRTETSTADAERAVEAGIRRHFTVSKGRVQLTIPGPIERKPEEHRDLSFALSVLHALAAQRDRRGARARACWKVEHGKVLAPNVLEEHVQDLASHVRLILTDARDADQFVVDVAAAACRIAKLGGGWGEGQRRKGRRR